MAEAAFENLILKGTSIDEGDLQSLLEMVSSDGINPVGDALAKKMFSSADDALFALCQSLDIDFIKAVSYTHLTLPTTPYV